jgi:hypothetical protein
MLVYFNGLLGAKRLKTQIMWNSEPVVWVLLLLFSLSVIFRLARPEEAAGPGIWYLTGAGNLLVVYIYLIQKLARHSLPVNSFWIAVAFIAISIVYSVARVATDIFAGNFSPADYASSLELLLLLLTEILCLILLLNLLRSLRSSFLQIWLAKPESTERHAAGAVSTSGEVSNPDAVLSDVYQQSSTISDEDPSTLQAGASIVVDFGIRRVEDHGYRADVRIVSSEANPNIKLEVSNDKADWQPCFKDDKISSDWDVPYINSPWQFLRIANEGSTPISISDIFDLD